MVEFVATILVSPTPFAGLHKGKGEVGGGLGVSVSGRALVYGDSLFENTSYYLWDHRLWLPTVQVPNASSGFSNKEIPSSLFLLERLMRTALRGR